MNMRIKKYLYLNHNNYNIQVRGLKVASRKKYEEIEPIYNECKETGWIKSKLEEIKDKYKKKKPHEMRYIHKNNKNYYFIMYKSKYIIGSKDYEEIAEWRDLLEENNWDTSILPKRKKKPRRKSNLPRYIQKTYNNKYRLAYDGEHYGTFETLEEAVEERDLLIKYDWTYDFIDLY